MDNITHTLIGLAIGHAAPVSKRLKPAAVWTAILASNIPDLDIVLQPLLGGGKITYLLHHRGHTHTLLIALPLGLASAAAGAWLGGLRRAAPEGEDAPRLDRRTAAILLAWGALGALVHIAADWTNNYGVHPLWPWANQWLYGDINFIVEPLMLLSLLPLAILNGKTPRRRRIWAALGAVLLAGIWLSGMTPWPVALAMTLYAAAVFAAQRRARESAWPALSALAIVCAGQAALARRARAEVLAEARAHLGADERVVDVVSTPAPANPFCWYILLSTVTDGGLYTARSVTLSHLPGVVKPARCFYRLGPDRTAPMLPVTPAALASNERFHWFGEFRGQIGELTSLVRERCGPRAAMRFFRAPYWIREDERAVLGDLRYDFEKELRFAEIEDTAHAPGACPKLVPPWIPPFAPLAPEVEGNPAGASERPR